MGADHGSVGTLTKLFDSGSPSSKWNLVIVADGYQSNQQSQFALDAQSLCDRFLGTDPFRKPGVRAGVNVYRLDVSSIDSGASKPQCPSPLTATTTAEDAGERDTQGPVAAVVRVRNFFDSKFCWDGRTKRLLYGNAALVLDTIADVLPNAHQIVVLVNDTERGGGGGAIAWSSTGGHDWLDVVIHEIGHSAFGLADEYDEPFEDWTGEPTQPNVTTNPDPATVKWLHLVNAGPDSPTRRNPTCGSGQVGRDPGPNPAPSGTVGTFEGAKYRRCAAYRPVWECKMRVTTRDFCPVCQERICKVLSGYA